MAHSWLMHIQPKGKKPFFLIKKRIYNPNKGIEDGVVLGLFPNDIVAVFVISV